MAFDYDGYLWTVGPGGAVRWNPTDGTYTKYTVEHGLASNWVSAIAVTPAPPGGGTGGTVWFGTASGVSRFDGRTWTTYTTKDGLANDWVSAIAVAPAPPGGGTGGALWFGTHGGVSRFDERPSADGSPVPSPYTDRRAGTWTTYTTKDGLAHDEVRSVAVAPAPPGGGTDGTVWFGTWGGGVSRFDRHPSADNPRAGTWTTYTTTAGLTYDYVQAIAVAPTPPGGGTGGTVWVGTYGGGAFRFDGKAWTHYIGTYKDGLAHNDVNAIAVAPGGVLWFGTDNGVSRFDGHTWTTYRTEDGLTHDRVTSIAVAPAPPGGGIGGTAWFGTCCGVSRFDGNPSARDSAHGQAGGSWAGTWTTYTTKDGLAHNEVRSVAVAPASPGGGTGSTVWFATRTGISRFDGYPSADDSPVPSPYTDRRAGTWTTYPTGRLWITSVAVAPDGVLWVGTEADVSCFDGKTWTTYTIADGLAHNWVECVVVAPALPGGGTGGTVWFGTASGVSRFDWHPSARDSAHGQADGSPVPSPYTDRRAGTWTTYRTEDGLANNTVLSIAISPASPEGGTGGTVWFGTYGGGVSRFDGRTWTTYTTKDGLAHNEVRSIAVAPASPGGGTGSTVWFGTGGGGVSRFDGNPSARDSAHGQAGGSPVPSPYTDRRAGTWTTYTTKDGLAGDWVSSIAVAPDGVLWFGTHGGVSRFDGRVWTTYTTKDGLAHDWVNSIAVAPDGALWFGTAGGGVSRYLPPK